MVLVKVQQDPVNTYERNDWLILLSWGCSTWLFLIGGIVCLANLDNGLINFNSQEIFPLISLFIASLSVACTPYWVAQGVSMFNWEAWKAPLME